MTTLSWPPRLAYLVGASEGIGLATAQALARLGTQVVIAGRSQAKLDRALETLPSTSRAVRADVRSREELTQAIDTSLLETGSPDLAIVTAGYARAAWLDAAAAEVAEDIIATNLLGSLNACAALVPALREAGGGRLVLTASMAGLTGVPGYSAYSASKFGVMGLAETLRRELHRDGISVTALCPPNTTTEGFAAENASKPAEVLKAEEKVTTLSPEAVAAYLLRRLPSGPRVVVPGLDSRLSAVAARHAPALVDRLLRRK